MHENKAELRIRLKQERQNLPDAEYIDLSKRICRQLEAIDWSDVRVLHCFEPFKILGEVDITSFIDKLRIRYPGLKLYTSRKIDGIWKVVSWKDHYLAESQRFDAVIVPMLGFDTTLQRIGYGGGYYDRFLSSQHQAKKIGVSFELGKIEHVPAESHDVSLDIIVTESSVY
jgi:5-formyltetrahydrofolate cyclo-ligase